MVATYPSDKTSVLKGKHYSSSRRDVSPRIFPILGLCLGLVIWLIDAGIDIFFLDEEQGLIENIFMPGITELWMRTLVVIVLTGMGVFARHSLMIQQHISAKLRHYQINLEDIVQQRTEALRKANETLREEVESRREAEKRLEMLATTDSLTGLMNRRKFSEVLEAELSRALRYKTPLSLIICDIDKFKLVNDTFGHGMGDHVLKNFAQILQDNTRTSDITVRWGGEEFIVLAPLTDMKNAKLVAEKLRGITEDTIIKDFGSITISLGVTEVRQGDTAHSLTSRADEMLYRAKGNGRNRWEATN